MEILLLLWDEIDDWTTACRHVVVATAVEFAAIPSPLVKTSVGVGALLSLAATFWGVHHHGFKVG